MKKRYLFLILIVCLFTISAVSATENVTDDFIGVEETTDEVLSSEDNTVIIEEAAGSVGTFTDLANDIKNTNDELNLTQDYKYTVGDNKEGIKITKTITINGNGHVIDGLSQSRIFNILSFVNLKNITFKNAKFSSSSRDWVGGGAIDITGDCNITSCTFENCIDDGENSLVNGGGAIYIRHGTTCNLINCTFSNCYSISNTGGAIFSWYGNCNIIGSNFINCHSPGYYGGGAIRIWGGNDNFEECNFTNCVGACGGAISSGDNEFTIKSNINVTNCIFNNNTCSNEGGAIYSWASNMISHNCTYINNNAMVGGAIYSRFNLKLINNNFINCTANNGNCIYTDGMVNTKLIFLNNLTCNGHIGEDTYLFAYLTDDNDNPISGGKITFVVSDKFIESSLIEGFSKILYVPKTTGEYIVTGTYSGNNDEYPSNIYNGILNVTKQKTNINIRYGEDNVIIATVSNGATGNITFTIGNISETIPIIDNVSTWNISNLQINDYSILAVYSGDNIFDSLSVSKKILLLNLTVKDTTVGFKTQFTVNILNYNDFPINGYIKFYVDNELLNETEIKNNIITTDFLSYTAKDYIIKVVFNGNENFTDYYITSKLTINKSDSSLIVADVNGTIGHDVTVIATVSSSNKLTINEGTITFFDGKTNIGESQVTNGKATITYTPTTAGEHAITAIFNSDNYLISNDTCKLLVDSATVDVLVDSGVVGFNSTFVANVKGLYSTVNEGNVKFYVGNEYLGKVPVVAGSASINYVPLIAGDYSVNVIYCDSDKFLDNEDSTSYHVSKADTKTIVNDLKGTVGHDVTITSSVNSSNKLSINEGHVTFFDGKNQIGESQVTNGKATITYTPTTAGEHTITTIFNSDNYLSSNDTALLSVKKANIDLTIADIAPVLFTNPSNFAVNVNSNYKAVNEGKIKYYVNNDLVGTTTVNGGVANLDYVTTTSGSFTLVVVYDETNNYLASNASSTFIVNKMPTVLSAESVIFDEKGDKIFTTNLKDDNSIGVSGQNVKIETIKYSGESRIFNGITDMDGIAEYDVKNLEGGMWFVTGTYDGNGNYIYSKFSDKFIVIRMDTITNIEGIDNHPQVNHTYKLKANIHDENGKLVKEGIVQFYLDGVDIGSIDLSKNKLSINDDLLGICNLIFDYKLGDDDSDLYIEYTPSKVGTYTLSAVYGGTTIYKSSNETTTLIVKEDSPFNVSAPDVTKYYGGPERFIVTLKDLNGNPIKNAVVKITINGRPSNRTTDDNGIASMGINLNSGVYITTTEYNGTKVNSTVTVKDTVIAKDFSKIFRNGTQYNGTFVDSQGNLIKNTDVKININGVFYTRTTDANGVAKMNINLNPGTYVLTATNPASGEQHTTVITVLPSIVENHDLTKFYKNESKYTLRILGGNGKPVGEGVIVKLNINGVFYERKTNATGYMNMNINLPPGTYTVTAEYNGLRASNTVKVLPVLSAKDVNMKYRDGTKFEAKLLNGKGNPFANQKITFNINGVFYERITDANGIARLNINLMAGEYIITSMYENGAALSNKVTIRS